MAQELTIEIGARVLEADSGRGNSRRRLIFAGDCWDEWDLTFCVHGVKLRWSCDVCDGLAKTDFVWAQSR